MGTLKCNPRAVKIGAISRRECRRVPENPPFRPSAKVGGLGAAWHGSDPMANRFYEVLIAFDPPTVINIK
jgi:hypothetical protein